MAASQRPGEPSEAGLPVSGEEPLAFAGSGHADPGHPGLGLAEPDSADPDDAKADDPGSGVADTNLVDPNAVDPNLADPGQRLLARIVDTLIVGLPVIIIIRELVTGQRVDVVAPPAVAGCLLLYEAVQLAVWGRTLGKRFAGIEVVVAPSQTGTEPATGPRRRGRLGILRATARAAVYALPVAARPVPILGLLAGFFWVANAGMLYEGTRRQALHDRLVGTEVRKRLPDELPSA
ncbi:RDD family protein [Actinomadura graeca]|uniref:RDD family protein n=1 Tax=Actinomadura graeca TaxID=2750812 RepID=A0ABX8QXI5_9ACTN|nr:RDD family protein [Actinomadura graeca]QXJ23505.1 RDD family protein [Actinomadura graeca]